MGSSYKPSMHIPSYKTLRVLRNSLEAPVRDKVSFHHQRWLSQGLTPSFHEKGLPPVKTGCRGVLVGWECMRARLTMPAWPTRLCSCTRLIITISLASDP